MNYAKIYIDKETLRKLIGIDNSIDFAITRLKLNPEDSFEITIVTDSNIEGFTSDKADDIARRTIKF